MLNANYVLARLSGAYNAPFPGPCMHECLFDDRNLKDTGISTLDIAKAMIDEGYHPMTMYFPLIVHGAMLIEPTETESRQSIEPVLRCHGASGGRGEEREPGSLPPRAATRPLEAARRDGCCPPSRPGLGA